MSDMRAFADSLVEQTSSYSPAEQAWIVHFLDRQLLRAREMVIESRHLDAIRELPGDPRTAADVEREAVAYTRWPTDEQWLTIAELYRTYRPLPEPVDEGPEVAGRRAAARLAIANLHIGGRTPSEEYLLLTERWIVREISTEQMIEAAQQLWGTKK